MAHWHIADTQSTALSIVSSEAKCFSIIISFVGHKRELSHRKLCIPLQTKHVLGKKFGGRVEQDQKAWAWKLDSHLCLSHFEHFFLTQDTRYKIQGLSQHQIHRWYVTNTWPMVYQCIADTLWILSQPTVDQRLICRYDCRYLTNTRPTLNWYATYPQQDSTEILINMSTDTLPIYQSICHPKLNQYFDGYVGQHPL